MLTPRELQTIAETLYPLLDNLNAWITQDIIRRLLARMGRGEEFLLTGTDEWQIEVYKSAGGHLEALQNKIQHFTKASDEEITRVFEDIGVRAWDADNLFYVSQGFESRSIFTSERTMAILQDTYNRTKGTVHMLNHQKCLNTTMQGSIMRLSMRHFAVNRMRRLVKPSRCVSIRAFPQKFFMLRRARAETPVILFWQPFLHYLLLSVLFLAC